MNLCHLPSPRSLFQPQLTQPAWFGAGFRVYLKRERSSTPGQLNAQQPFNAEYAQQRGYHITWMANTGPCHGAGETTPSQWTAYNWDGNHPNAMYTDVTFPSGAFPAMTGGVPTVPIIVAS